MWIHCEGQGHENVNMDNVGSFSIRNGSNILFFNGEAKVAAWYFDTMDEVRDVYHDISDALIEGSGGLVFRGHATNIDSNSKTK